MAIPTLRSAAVDLYDAVQPLQYAEEENDYALAKYCGALGELLQQVDEYVRDTDTRVGWGTLLDPDLAPVEVLQWLGQFAGVQPEPLRQTLLYTNLVTNPSAELSLSGYAGLGSVVPTLTKIAENPAAGQNSIRVFYLGAGSSSSDRIEWQVNLTNGVQYTFYGSYIWTPGIFGRHWVVDNASTNLGSAGITSDGSRWSPYVTFTATANNPHRLRFGRNTSGADFFAWIDTWMVTQGATQFPYVDGDQPGGRWTGSPHASTSEKWDLELEADYWARQRVRIKDKLGFERGSRDAMINAAKSWLTGSKAVYFNERDTSPYHITVSTKLSETPNAPAVAAALQAQKPAGLVMVVQTIAGQDWNNLVATRASWTAVGAAYATWQAEING